MIVVRYADDLGVGFEHEADARRFLDMMRARLEAFALTLHSKKTRLIEFGRRAAADASADPPTGGMAAGGGQRVVQLPRGADQHPLSPDLR